MNVPSELRYSSEHCWARLESGRVRIGLTDFAQEALGDVVFVSVPEVGTSVERDSVLGEVESTKSVSEIYAPLPGVVGESNEALVRSPELVNTDPYGAAWICVIEPSDADAFEALLDAASYDALTAE